MAGAVSEPPRDVASPSAQADHANEPRSALTIRVAASPGEAHVAVVRADHLIDYALWRFGAPDGVGDIVSGRVIAVVPAMAGAFLALPDSEGFLPDSEGAKGLTVGTMLPVRITRSAQGGKGPRLSARLPQGAQLGPGPTPVQRMLARYPGATVLSDDPSIAARIGGRSVSDLLDDDIADAIEALSEPEITLPTGARLAIWPTPALVAIDVDSAGAFDRGVSARGQHEALNRALMPALAAQIRMRALSGAILIDFAGMAIKRRASLAPDLIAALATDPLHPRLLGFTALGLAEVVRPRVHPPLHELLASPLAAGLAGLRAALAATSKDPRSQPALRAHPAVVMALQADPVALEDLRHRTGRALTLRSDPTLPAKTWMIEAENG